LFFKTERRSLERRFFAVKQEPDAKPSASKAFIFIFRVMSTKHQATSA